MLQHASLHAVDRHLTLPPPMSVNVLGYRTSIQVQQEKAGTIKLDSEELLILPFPLVFGGEAGSLLVALSASIFTLADELPAVCACSLD